MRGAAVLALPGEPGKGDCQLSGTRSDHRGPPSASPVDGPASCSAASTHGQAGPRDRPRHSSARGATAPCDPPARGPARSAHRRRPRHGELDGAGAVGASVRHGVGVPARRPNDAPRCGAARLAGRLCLVGEELQHGARAPPIRAPELRSRCIRPLSVRHRCSARPLGAPGRLRTASTAVAPQTGAGCLGHHGTLTQLDRDHAGQDQQPAEQLGRRRQLVQEQPRPEDAARRPRSAPRTTPVASRAGGPRRRR